MTTTPATQALLPVTQSDRDAAADLALALAMEMTAHVTRKGKHGVDQQPLTQAFARHRHQSGRTGAGEALPQWVYDIQWGPEGQQDYAHVYDLGGNLIAVMKTHDAARVAKHRGGDQ